MLVFPDVSAEREDGAHKLVLDEDQSAVPAGRTRAPRPTHTCPIPTVQQRQATPVSASACRQPDYHKSAFTNGKLTHWPYCFSFILQIWYKVKKQLVQQCNTRSNCEYSKHTKETFWMIYFSPLTVTRIGDWNFQASKMTEKHHKSIIKLYQLCHTIADKNVYQWTQELFIQTSFVGWFTKRTICLWIRHLLMDSHEHTQVN